MKLPCRSVKLYKQESGVVVGNVVQTSLGKENENNVSEMNSV